MKKQLLLLFFGAVCLFTAHSQMQNVLERFAKFNVDSLNTLTSGNEWSVGLHYQWGRNISFSDRTLPSTISQLEYPSDANAWVDEFIKVNEAPFNWFKDGGATDTWKSTVSYTMSGRKSPKAYRGGNNGDPCPCEYRLPTHAEMKSIVYQVRFSKEDDVSDKKEFNIDIEGKGKLNTYLADYKNISSSRTVALRFKNTEHATAFKYEWIDGKGLQISAKLVAGENLEDVISENYDWSDAVVRYFPAAGFINHQDGKYYSKGNIGYYMTNNALNPNASATLYLRNNFINSLNGFNRAHAFSIRCIKVKSN